MLITDKEVTVRQRIFPMPEGRVVNNSGTLAQEFILTDQQGNARVSFQNNGSGSAVVKQENSYYGFGMQLANSPVTPTGTPNKRLYNGGSEWQNDYTGNLPDYYQTFNRNYDAALGRFIGVDPKAESAESLTSYQYAGNNPILFNDPLGDLLPTPGSHTPPPVDYSSSQLLPNTGPLDATWQNSAAMGGVYNLYGTNPDAYWDLYNSGALAGGDGSIYHAGDGTSADPHTGMDASTLVALTSGTASYSLDFTTNVWEIKSNTAEANSYGEIRGGVTIYDWGILKPASGNSSTTVINQKESNTSDKVLAVFGAAAYSTENFSGITRLGSNIQLYKAAEKGGVFMGNQFVKTIGVAKIGRGAGIAGGLVTMGLDAYGLFNNTVPVSKFGVDGAMTAVGIWGGPVGGAAATIYFGIDAFAPGFWPGVGEYIKESQQDNEQNHYPAH